MSRNFPSNSGCFWATNFSLLVLYGLTRATWEVGVDWENVLPAWFKVLSATAGPSEYAQGIATVLKRHYKHGRIKDVRSCAQDCDAGATPGSAGTRVRLKFVTVWTCRAGRIV